MLKNMVITRKFPLVMVAFAILSAFVTAMIAYTSARNSLMAASEENIISLLESRKASLLSYIDDVKSDVNFHAQSPLVVDALRAFSNAWIDLPGEKTQYLQDIYINQNPFGIGRKGSLLTGPDQTKYNQIHHQYHPVFQNIIDMGLFHDVFIFNTDGDLIYSVAKEYDFSENLVTGRWKDTGLAQMFRGVSTNPIPGKQLYIDFANYAPSGGAPASFIGSAVFDDNNNYIGVLGFQLPIKPLDQVMRVTAGMGKTGETYLVGADLLMRSNSRFFPDSSILKIKVDTDSVQKALTGEAGILVMRDYRGIPVFSAYTPISFFDAGWVMLAEVDHEEVMEPIYAMTKFLLIAGIVLTVIIAFIGTLLARDISMPIVTMTRTMTKLANNELDTNISVEVRGDEVGGMAKALVVFKKNASEREFLQQELNRISDHDALTSLPSRRYAVQKLDRMIEEAGSNQKLLALMFIDLDSFKIINDVQGYDIGDVVLKEIADLLRANIRTSDFVARLSGDEFIVVLPDIENAEGVRAIVEKIADLIKNRNFSGGETTEVYASIGVSIYPDFANNRQSLLAQADGAMQQAKKGGKNRLYYFNPSLS